MKRNSHCFLLSTTIIFLMILNILKFEVGQVTSPVLLEMYLAATLLVIWWIYEIIKHLFKDEKESEKTA